MLIKTGKCPPSEPWQILEVAMNQSPDVLALRLSKELKRLHAAAEVLIPMKRNAAGDCEWLIEHVYVRGLNGSLRQFARTPGIDSIRKETAPPEWIQQLQTQELSDDSPVRRGSFVRVLTGPCARLCGKAVSVGASGVTVVIAMHTKNLTVHASHLQVQPISCSAQPTFFYQS